MVAQVVDDGPAPFDLADGGAITVLLACVQVDPEAVAEIGQLVVEVVLVIPVLVLESGEGDTRVDGANGPL